jgi:PAS domain S-box-containing protein
MQHVPKKWLDILNYGLVSLDLIYICFYLLYKDSHYAQTHWGITFSVLAVVLVHLFYVLVIYRLISKRLTWLSNVISMTIYAMIFSTIIDASGNTNLVYRLGYAGLVFLTALTGVFTPLAAVILTWIVLLFSITGTVSGTKASLTFNIIIDCIVTIAAISGWLIFRRYYLKDKEVVSLSGALAKEQTKSTVVLEYITDGVVVVNTKGLTELVNVSAASMFGWNKQEATGVQYQSLYTVLADGVKPEIDVIGEVLITAEPKQALLKVKSRHGKERYVDVVSSPMFEDVYADGKTKPSKQIVGVIAVFRDVDQQKREEQERNNFISTASHEMRTPVATIEGFLELSLTPKIFQDPATLETYLRRALDRTQQLGQLFQDLLTVSRSDDGQLSFNLKTVETRHLINEVVNKMRAKASMHHLSIGLDDPENKEHQLQQLINVQADVKRLQEVLLNLVDNAIKYTHEGSIKVGVKVSGNKAIISVRDTGLGMAEEDIPHLFQKFYRVDNTSTREVGGTGLGLYICRQMIEQMHGRIWVESKLGVGSTFFVELPLATQGSTSATT